MKLKLSILVLLLFFSIKNLSAFELVEDIATKAGGYEIPIKICIPENRKEKMPVMFFVHGGGWNGGDDKKVPDASIPADCKFLCDEMGIIYVGLAYRCKGNKGTFHQALDDLQASVKWFGDRAERFNADMSRIGFSGGSAGTTLSAVLAQRYPNCKIYIGREGMYNVLDMDSTLSNFPNAQSRADFGLVTQEQKLEASPIHQIRKNPATALLLHGKDDWLCHYSQSLKYADALKNAGGKSKLVLYDDINHTCLNISYPDVFRNSVKEIAKIMKKGYGLKKVNFKAIQANVDERTEYLYAYENIPGHKITGIWKSLKNGTFKFYENGEGEYISQSGALISSFSFINKGSNLLVSVENEHRQREFYLRKNDHTMYELITENTRWKSRRNDFRKQ